MESPSIVSVVSHVIKFHFITWRFHFSSNAFPSRRVDLDNNLFYLYGISKLCSSSPDPKVLRNTFYVPASAIDFKAPLHLFSSGSQLIVGLSVTWRLVTLLNIDHSPVDLMVTFIVLKQVACACLKENGKYQDYIYARIYQLNFVISKKQKAVISEQSNDVNLNVHVNLS